MAKNTSDENTTTEVSLTISSQTIIRIVLLIVGTIFLLAALRQASHALLLIFTAVFLALSLNAPVSWIARHIPGKKRGSRVLGTTAAFVLVLAVLISFLTALIPPIVKQTQSFIKSVPGLVSDARDENSEVGRFVQRYNLQDDIDKFSKEASSRLDSITGSAVSTVTRVGNSVFSILTVLVLTFMMLIEGPRWVKLAKELVPTHRRSNFNKVLNDMYRVVKGYVNGQVTLAAIAAIMLLPGLLIFGVSYPFALLGVVFVCGLIPMVGHTIGAVIVTLVALFTSPLAALGILIYHIVYQQIENYLVQPRVQANSTNMSPLLVFASVVIGVSFSGLLGGLVAIPVAGCLRILVLNFLEQRKVLAGKPVLSSEITKAEAGTK